jgi:hypothetical protein
LIGWAKLFTKLSHPTASGFSPSESERGDAYE